MAQLAVSMALLMATGLLVRALRVNPVTHCAKNRQKDGIRYFGDAVVS
ncbi:MAG TPA: hypothetical protein VGT08_20725 [Terracidiphilus sp.]|nr:hypothetical protein [Terracidiphilus sp.]